MEYGYDSLRVSYLMMIKWVDMASLCANGLGTTGGGRASNVIDLAIVISVLRHCCPYSCSPDLGDESA